MISRAVAPLALVLLVLACGGDTPPPPAKKGATPAAAKSAPTPAAKPSARARAAASDTGPVGLDSTQLQREVFAYRGAGRDPFLSLLKSDKDRPLVGDVRVASITFDRAYPARSVAVLRDTAQHNKRYAVRIGDEVGRMKVTQIRDDAVVVTVDEFGAEKQVVLPVRRGTQQEGTQ